MTKEELLKTHKIHKENVNDWNFFSLTYEGGRKFLEHVLERNVRESEANWKQRTKEGVLFNYASAIVDLFNFYLTEKPATRILSGLEEDPLWKEFFKDCDFKGTNFDLYVNEISKLSSIHSCVGILVNKGTSPQPVISREDEINNGNYPYVCTYTPQNILDWQFSSTFGTKPELLMIKLREENGDILIYTKTTWQIWRVANILTSTSTENVVLVAQGINMLGVVPFFWSYNMKSPSNQHLGVSDIKDISLIVASICRNVSSGDEIIKYAGFPMMRVPMQTEGQQDQFGNEIIVSPRGVLEFNPEHGLDGKPDWLETQILEPIEAILNWTDRKADEIYRIAHLSGVHGQRKSNNEVASGLALRYEFQQLNSVLGQKSDQCCETELTIIRFWLMWQNRTDLFDKIEINRSKQFSIEDLSISLENCRKSMEMVLSNHYKKLLQHSIVRQMLPDISEADEKIIQKELETTELEPVNQKGKTIDNPGGLI